MRTLQVDSRLAEHRLFPIGSTGTTVFLKVQRENSVEIWSLNTLFPNSWARIFCLDLVEIYYSFSAFSFENRRIFLLVFGTTLANQDEANLYEIDVKTRKDKVYCLSPDFSADFFAIPFETAYLSHGKKGLHIYDRGIIMEDIPYWNIELQEATFSLLRNDIRDVEKLKCDRFPIAVDSGARIFARLLSDKRLVISSADSNQWQEYIQSAGSSFNLSDLDTRGIRETFSRGGGHRAGAVQSPLTVYSDGSTIIAKVNHNKATYFYRILLDHEAKEFTCVLQASARFSGGLEQMFYATVNPQNFFAVGIRAIGVVSLQPASLAENALWALQKTKLKTNKEGVQSDGYSFDFFMKFFGLSVMSSFQ